MPLPAHSSSSSSLPASDVLDEVAEEPGVADAEPEPASRSHHTRKDEDDMEIEIEEESQPAPPSPSATSVRSHSRHLSNSILPDEEIEEQEGISDGTRPGTATRPSTARSISESLH